jgi:hypothetical protein
LGRNGPSYGGRRFLTGAQLRMMRLQLSDLDAKLRQLSAVERERRR